MECCSVSSFMLNHEYELQLMQLRTSFFFFHASRSLQSSFVSVSGLISSSTRVSMS